MCDRVKKIEAREILSGTGRPTVEVELWTEKGIRTESSVPSGTSRGSYESFELYDGGHRYRGCGVRKAVKNINEVIAPKISGLCVVNQSEIDNMMLELDGTEDQRRLGGNAILAVSLAVARAGAESLGLPLYRYIGGLTAVRLPVPIATVIAGGKHSPSALDFEDYILILDGFSRFSESLEALVETRLLLEEIIRKKYGNVPDIGGALAPPIDETDHAFDLMMEAIEKAGCREKIRLGLDVAANELYIKEKNMYRISGTDMGLAAVIEYFENLTKQYPLTFIEDPFEENDYAGFAEITAHLPDTQIVGDDLFVSNPRRIRTGIEKNACNTLLLKINQIGTVSGALEAAILAFRNNYSVTVSLRSNDTNDSFIADFAVAIGAGQIKLGSPFRGERNAKYNRLLKIEKNIGERTVFL